MKMITRKPFGPYNVGDEVDMRHICIIQYRWLKNGEWHITEVGPGFFEVINESISQSSVNSAIASLKELIGQDIQRIEFK